MQARLFINRVRQELKEYGCRLRLANSDYVVGDGFRCAGYFDPNKKLVAVAVGSLRRRAWLGTLVHEYCHFRQWREQHPAWLYAAGMDHVFDEWLAGENHSNYVVAGKLVQNLEADCERRVIEVCAQHNLDLNVRVYARKANAYLYWHDYMLKYRKWYEVGQEPYTVPQIWTKMPDEIAPSYFDTNDKYVKILEQYYLGGRS